MSNPETEEDSFASLTSETGDWSCGRLRVDTALELATVDRGSAAERSVPPSGKLTEVVTVACMVGIGLSLFFFGEVRE